LSRKPTRRFLNQVGQPTTKLGQSSAIAAPVRALWPLVAVTLHELLPGLDHGRLGLMGPSLDLTTMVHHQRIPLIIVDAGTVATRCAA